MAELITIELGDGSQGAAVFEVDDDLVGADLERVPGEAVVARARMSLQEAMDQLGPTLSKVFQTIRRLGPHEAELEFGLKMGGETGVIVAKGTADVNFAVRLVWRSH
ncbi:CU044_2847 family protein [Streptomyces sp. TRM49041]|uniref:CU044_2847 family protein n=1 Tax=Streptomyces sp. TRM49041 TaxID=2603216 RepID=UPI0011EC65DD|nr:CU044_2847 family protein [Streptomyces sp. TRM49041]